MTPEDIQNVNEASKAQALTHAAFTAPYITDLAQICHKLAVLSGWHSEVPTEDKALRRYKLAMICLEHTELSESTEGVRKGVPDDHLPHRPKEEVEAADAIIRILDRMALGGYDIGGAILEKLQYNTVRPDHKPEARAAEGGKKL